MPALQTRVLPHLTETRLPQLYGNWLHRPETVPWRTHLNAFFRSMEYGIRILPKRFTCHKYLPYTILALLHPHTCKPFLPPMYKYSDKVLQCVTHKGFYLLCRHVVWFPGMCILPPEVWTLFCSLLSLWWRYPADKPTHLRLATFQEVLPLEAVLFFLLAKSLQSNLFFFFLSSVESWKAKSLFEKTWFGWILDFDWLKGVC